MGGLTKEWFLLLIRQIFQPEYGTFDYIVSSTLILNIILYISIYIINTARCTLLLPAFLCNVKLAKYIWRRDNRWLLTLVLFLSQVCSHTTRSPSCSGSAAPPVTTIKSSISSGLYPSLIPKTRNSGWVILNLFNNNYWFFAYFTLFLSASSHEQTISMILRETKLKSLRNPPMVLK